jgi:hypothetical protein
MRQILSDQPSAIRGGRVLSGWPENPSVKILDNRKTKGLPPIKNLTPGSVFCVDDAFYIRVAWENTHNVLAVCLSDGSWVAKDGFGPNPKYLVVHALVEIYD